MLISCSFNFIKCYPRDFIYSYSSHYGNCYTFNSGLYSNGTKYTPRSVSLNGQFYGLTLEIFLGDPSKSTTFQTSNGIFISINNQSSEQFIDGNLLKAESGAETDFVLSRNFVNKLPSPHGSCSFTGGNQNYYKFIVNTLGKNYTRELCLQFCLQEEIVKKCNCANIYLSNRYSSAQYCKNPQHQQCVTEFFNDYITSIDCELDCPYECNYVNFEISLSKSKYPTLSYTNKLKEYINGKGINITNSNDIASAFTKVNIYYQSAEYKIITQTPRYDLSEVSSLVGGIIGVFLGMSYLTLCEFIEIILIVIFSLKKFYTSRSDSINI